MEKEEFEVIAKVKELEQELKASKEDFEEQLSDHFLSINDNTQDCINNMEYVYEVEQKLNKLSSRVDDIYLMLKEFTNPIEIPLNNPEQKVFLTLYTYGENGLLNSHDIARKCNVEETTVRKCIFDMILKGVKVTCEKVDYVDYFKLDPSFRDQQARKNIIKIADEVRKELLNGNLSNYFVIN